MTDAPHYRLDDLRRFATALGSAQGLAPARSAALATQLLWFDAAGAASFGIGTLADWLDRIEAREVDPLAEGRVVSETLGTVIFDGQNGLPPLILARAGELAVEKARDAGIGLVRVENVGATGPAAAVVAEMAIGPVAALALGPGPSWSLALPSDKGLPVVVDLALGIGPVRSKLPPRSAPARILPGAPWASMLVPDGGWLVGALTIPAIEPLATFQERVGATSQSGDEWPGLLAPLPWETRRREARERGIALGTAAWKKLRRWADRLGIDPPAPAPG